MAQLQFKGKQFVQSHHLIVPYYELIPQKDKSLTEKVSLHDNLIIHGDNLLALKSLLPTYAGKIKCIYIDPPYNTGNEGWVYSDNVNSPMMQEWLKTNKPVDNEDLTRHDKWLCMMTPRLKLLKELLREDGVIFVSIDDNEVHHLRMLMDEIFNEENFTGTITWEKRTKAQNTETARDMFQSKTEYILIYKKSGEKIKFNLKIKSEKKYDLIDDKGAYRLKLVEEMSSKGMRGRQTMIFPINGILPKEDKQWKVGQEQVKIFEDRGDVEIQNSKIYFRIRPSDESNENFVPFWSHFFDKDTYGTAEVGKSELSEILGNDDHGFETVKPVSLIKKLLFHITKTTNLDPSQSDLILDSFSGSGTTAQAVLDLNKEDGGDRKFILVEMEDYADKITAERVRRVIKGVSDAKDENLKNGLGGSFSYFELGKPIEMESILSGKNLPTYMELARYVFYTATGEEFDENKVDEKENFVGKTKQYEVYLFYKPDLEYLKNTALTLDRAKTLGVHKGKRRLVFAPTKYLDQDHLDELRIDFAQLPFEIYKLAK